MRRGVAALTLFFAGAAMVQHHDGHSPHAVVQQRSIKALGAAWALHSRLSSMAIPTRCTYLSWPTSYTWPSSKDGAFSGSMNL
jgi:hypothetical protein